MGEKRTRVARFLAEHPYCCFCGDRATTEDHCPARICFRGKEGPEGWSYPACYECNRAISGTEQVVAFYIRALDFTEANMRSEDLQRLISGVRNNFPDLFPKFDHTANEKRKMLAHLGIKKDPNGFIADEPVIAVPVSLGPHLDFFMRKLTAALYYRQTGLILTEKHLVMGRWLQTQDPSLEDLLEQLSPAWTHKAMGRRRNMDFGDQLSVIIAAGSAPTVMSYIAQFGSSLCFWGAAGLPGDERLREIWVPYRPIKDGI